VAETQLTGVVSTHAPLVGVDLVHVVAVLAYFGSLSFKVVGGRHLSADEPVVDLKDVARASSALELGLRRLLARCRRCEVVEWEILMSRDLRPSLWLLLSRLGHIDVL
jgi:hypothetical protein